MYACMHACICEVHSNMHVCKCKYIIYTLYITEYNSVRNTRTQKLAACTKSYETFVVANFTDTAIFLRTSVCLYLNVYTPFTCYSDVAVIAHGIRMHCDVNGTYGRHVR